MRYGGKANLTQNILSHGLALTSHIYVIGLTCYQLDLLALRARRDVAISMRKRMMKFLFIHPGFQTPNSFRRRRQPG